MLLHGEVKRALQAEGSQVKYLKLKKVKKKEKEKEKEKGGGGDNDEEEEEEEGKEEEDEEKWGRGKWNLGHTGCLWVSPCKLVQNNDLPTQDLEAPFKKARTKD